MWCNIGVFTEPISWSWQYLSTSVEPSGSIPFCHDSRFFEYFPDQRLPVHIHKPCFSKKLLFIILQYIVPVLAANLLFLYFSPMCLSSIFPPGFPSVFYSYVPFLYYFPVYSFCIVFLYAFSALSSNVTFLYYPFIFLFCVGLPCTVTVLTPNVEFLYFSPCTVSVLSFYVSFLHYPAVCSFCIMFTFTVSLLSSHVPFITY